MDDDIKFLKEQERETAVSTRLLTAIFLATFLFTIAVGAALMGAQVWVIALIIGPVWIVALKL